MPLEHRHAIKEGTTGKLLLVYAASTDDPAQGKPGLTHQTAGAVAAYVREGEPSAREITLVPGRVGGWTSGGFVEVDPRLLPGVYQLGAPDEMLAEGAVRVLVLLRFPGARIAPIDVHLVAYDPQDGERIGVWGLANHKRHEFLRRALPRLTEMELALGEEAEGKLRRRMREEGG
jgi:hypothetical protein